ncbi:7-cyano-7-deazaguanine reductase, partial [Gammaproteobacteria bacterium]|nr:7-cyano-7-deazaguanine reductase [Gammaproteobacteria bacterium]
MKTSVLGKTNKPQKKGKNLLDPIMRNKDSIKHGIDIWNVYDFMYLDKNKIPKLKVLEIQIPYESNIIVESKSMKLYLNEFYKKSFKTEKELI